MLIRRCWVALLMLCSLVGNVAAEGPRKTLVIGLSAEFGVKNSHAAQSIERGIRLALDEINSSGGVAGYRLLLETRDDRGLPARGKDNFKAFAENPEVVAVFGGRFSPVVIEVAPLAADLGLLLLDPWAAADDITQPIAKLPNYVYRLSLTDTWAMQTMLDHARQRKLKRLALMIPNTAWGRSCEAAMLAYQRKHPELRFDAYQYNWGDTNFNDALTQISARRTEALIMVANEFEGSRIVKHVASLPPEQRLPIISHWGLLGGDFYGVARDSLAVIDFSVVHTFSFSDPDTPRSRSVKAGIRRLFNVEAEELHAQVGFAHAYDLTHLLAKAIAKVGNGNRAAIRTALEQLDSHQGLVRKYVRPFAPGRHEALDQSQVSMARYDKDGQLKSIRP